MCLILNELLSNILFDLVDKQWFVALLRHSALDIGVTKQYQWNNETDDELMSMWKTNNLFK